MSLPETTARSGGASVRSSLGSAFERWGGVPEPVLAALEPEFRTSDHLAGDHLVAPGGALDELLVVERGLLRFYQLDDRGREWNKGFLSEGWIAGPLADGAAGWPAPNGLEALEPSRLHRAPVGVVLRLARRHAELDAVLRRYVGWLLELKTSRLAGFQRLSAAERYVDFLGRHPELRGRLPQYQIASYLGITEVSLSRLRRRVVRRSGAS